MEGKDFEAAVRRLRDHVSNHPLQPTLMADTDSWTTLCDAMDALQNWQGDSQPEILAQQEAMDTIRRTLGIEVSDWTGATEPHSNHAALQASLEAVNAELGDRTNAHFEKFDREPITPLLKGSGYSSSLVAGIVTKHISGDDTQWERVGLNSLETQLRAVGEALAARHLNESHHTAELDDALFILRTIKGVLGTDLSNDRGRELAILAGVALPALVSAVEQLAASVDENYRERRPGWMHR